MKKAKTISCLLVAFLVLVFFVPASSFAQDEGSWTYEVSNGEATITAYSGPDGAVTIPAQLGGHAITAIGSDVFTTVNITSLVIPKGILAIDGGAFWECRSLKNIDIEAENPNYTSIDGIVYSKDKTTLVHYPAAKSGTFYAVPDHVTAIGRCAFDHNQNLQSISLPETVLQIGDSAFWRCQSLIDLTIPKSVTAIGDAAFANCSSLTDLTVDAANPSYKSMDGVLFDISGDSLIQYPAGKSGSYSVPQGTLTLCSGSFRGCTQLKQVVVSDSVTTISDSVFAYCDGLEQISLSSGVKTIGSIAFQGCSRLAYVKFPASVTEIEDMAFDSCSNLQAAYFFGNPPVWGSNVFQSTAANFMVFYHYSSKSGWNGFAEYSTMPFCVIIFDSLGGSAVPEQMVKVGEMVTCPEPPEYPEFAFGGWHTDAACTLPWDFEKDAANEDFTLYANWTAALVLSSSDPDGKINEGESFSLTPSIEGGTWSYDKEYLSLSGSTFTAVKSGAVTVSYTVDKQTAEYSITIEESVAATPTIEQGASAPKEQDFPLLAPIAAFVAILLSVGLWVGLKKHKRNNDQ